MKINKQIKEELINEHNYLCEKLNELLKMYNKKPITKNKIEKLQEKISIKIELEKIKNRINVLSRVIDATETKISLSKYNIEKYENNIIATPKSINEELKKILEKEYKKLDILSTKKILIKEFDLERQKGIYKYEFGPFPMLGGIISSFCLGIPFIKIVNLPFSISNLLLPLIASYLVGHILVVNMQIKRTNRRIKVFNNLNNQLEEEKLNSETKESFKEFNDIEILLDKLIHNIMIIEMTQREFQKAVEIFNTTQKSNNNLKRQRESNISWVAPYLREDIETDELYTETKESKLTKKLTLPKKENDK